MIRVISAFVRRDFLAESSYRLSFALGALATLANLAVFYFIGKMFGGGWLAPDLAPYGKGYFQYVFVALAFFGYIGTGAGSYAGRLRQEQAQGTLEATLSTPLGTLPFLAALTAWNFLFATFELLVYALAGAFLFRLELHANWPAAALVFALSAACFAALGVLSSCFVVLFKRGNPLAWVLNNFEGLLGGVYFPVTVLPGWLLPVSSLLPVTYAVRAFQLAVNRGAGLAEIKGDLLALVAFDIVLVPAAVWLFGLSVRRSRRTGTLGEY